MTVIVWNDTEIKVLLPDGSVFMVSLSKRHTLTSRKCLCVIVRTPGFLEGESCLRLTPSLMTTCPSFRRTKRFLNVVTVVSRTRKGGTRWLS